MLTFRIIGTVLIGLSVATSFVKTFGLYTDDYGFIPQKNKVGIILLTFWNVLWRAFVITALWIL